MGIELSDKTRKINNLLQNSTDAKILFSDVCNVLTETLASTVFVISKKGKVLGFSKTDEYISIPALTVSEVGEYIDESLNERLLNVLSTKENANLAMLGLDEKKVKGYNGMIVPVYISGERLGTVLMYRKKEAYSIDDIIVSEYGATVVSLQLLSAVNEENVDKARRKQVVDMALSSLSATELESVKHVIGMLEGGSGMLIASKIADDLGITRSIIVNAIRKFESAGIIVSQSLGMKGTSITVLNDMVYEALGLENNVE